MAVQFPDLNPTPTSNAKDVQVKVVRLLASDFIVGTVSSVKATLPADSTIISIQWWKKTQFSGGGVSAALLSIGVVGFNQYVSNFDVMTPATGTSGFMTPLTNIMQPYQVPTPLPDLLLSFGGGAAGGNPTAGEIYVSIHYVR